MVVFWNCCNLCFCSWDAVFNGFNDGIYGFYDEGVNDGIIKKINEMIIYRMCVVVEDISVCGWCDVWGFMLKVILFYFVFFGCFIIGFFIIGFMGFIIGFIGGRILIIKI